MITQYTYQKEVNLEELNRVLNTFIAQMNAEELTEITLDHTATLDSNVLIFFSDALSENAKTQLDAAIASYTMSKVLAEQQVKPMEVVTQFELNNKDLKLARAKLSIANNQGVAYILVPGVFGQPGEGRYVAGGYALVDTYDPDDNVKVYVEDKDRLLAAAYGNQAQLGRSMTDQEMQGQGDFPQYPIVKSYTDDELPEANQGWHFWPYHASTLGGPPSGETEVDPIGGYGFIPAGFYLKIIVTRPNVQTGSAMFDIFWGKLE